MRNKKLHRNHGNGVEHARAKICERHFDRLYSNYVVFSASYISSAVSSVVTDISSLYYILNEILR